MKNQIARVLIIGLTFLSATVQATEGTVDVSGKVLRDSVNSCVEQLIHDTLLKYEGQDFIITEPSFGTFDLLRFKTGMNLSHAEIAFVAADKTGGVLRGTFVAHVKSTAVMKDMWIGSWNVSCSAAANENSCGTDDLNYSLSTLQGQLLVQRVQFKACSR